jgi:hypothetical protein
MRGGPEEVGAPPGDRERLLASNSCGNFSEKNCHHFVETTLPCVNGVNSKMPDGVGVFSDIHGTLTYFLRSFSQVQVVRFPCRL